MASDLEPAKCRKSRLSNDLAKNLRYQTINEFAFLKSNFSPGPPVPLSRVCMFNAWVVARIVPSLKTSIKSSSYHLVLDLWVVTTGNK